MREIVCVCVCVCVRACTSVFCVYVCGNLLLCYYYYMYMTLLL